MGDDWLHARYHAITGTDIGKILGCDPSTSRSKLFECKALEVDPLGNASKVTKGFLSMGREFESVALIDLIRQTGFEGFVPGMTPSKDCAWLTGTPDFVVPNNTLVEIKTHFYPTPLDAQPISSVAQIPPKYWLQVQAYLEIMNLPHGWLWSWTIAHQGTMFYIPRDKEFWASNVVPQITWFWNELERVRDKINSPEWVAALAGMRWGRGEKGQMVDRVTTAMYRTVLQVDPATLKPIPCAGLGYTAYELKELYEKYPEFLPGGSYC